jgi:hypothetical protein
MGELIERQEVLAIIDQGLLDVETANMLADEAATERLCDNLRNAFNELKAAVVKLPAAAD